MAHGGARPGAGAKKGSKSKRSQALADEIKGRVAKAGAKLPLDIMLEAIGIIYADESVDDDGRPRGGAVRAFDLCVAAAPYLHPKLSTVEANVKGELVVEVVRFTGV